MSEESLLRHCSPTLAGIKTGNILTCAYADAAAMRDSLRRWNGRLGRKGLRVIPLRYRDGRALIYVYRPAQLARDLQQSETRRLLRQLGYLPTSADGYIMQLIGRLSDAQEFPHEIGLFIGYPPEDVRGFIHDRREGCKCVGCWKVYGDPQQAERLFAKYRKCTAVYCRQHANGRSVEQLTVAG